jgi:hypothetical protein
MVSSLLYDLPATETYRVLFMERDIDEVLQSQEKMLVRLGRPVAPAEQMKQSYAIHLERLFKWLPQQSQMKLLKVNYNDLLADPIEGLRAVVEFLDRRPAVDKMLSAIDTSLYRNRAKQDDLAREGTANH